MRNFCLLFLLLLAGCTGGARNAAMPAVYDFGPLAASTTPLAQGPASSMALEVNVPRWLEGPSIDYRLLYDDPLKRRQYADSRWAGTPASLLAQQLRHFLGAAGSNGGLAVDCLLRVEVHEFSHVFDTPQQSRGVLQARTSVIDGQRRLLADHIINIDRLAFSPDARGGVRAMVATGEELARQLVAWLGNLEKNEGLRTCKRSR